jgi:hypothetical protein
MVYTSKEFRRADCRYRSYMMLYIARGIATVKFCDATPCRLVNNYAYTNTDGVISQKYLLVVRRVCNPQVFRNTMPFCPFLPDRH